MIWRVIFTCFALLGILAVYSVYRDMRLQEYLEQHECTYSGKTQEYFALVPSYNPSTKHWTTTPVYWPAREIYKCNDGKEYTK